MKNFTTIQQFGLYSAGIGAGVAAISMLTDSLDAVQLAASTLLVLVGIVAFVFGKSTKRALIATGILAVLLAAGLVAFSSHIYTPKQQPQPPAASSQTYTNETHGFSLEYPTHWHEGDGNSDNLFQLYNYDVSSVVGGHGWGEDQNKVEGVIVPDGSYGTSSTYPEESREETRVSVDGREATRYDVVLENGTHVRSYVIPLQNEADEYTIISIYGDDTDNFQVLERAIDTLTFER